MAKVRVAPSLGFCEGVRRAFTLAERALEEENSVFLLGELIHNRDAVELLLAKGARIALSPEDIPQGATVVTRSHGTPKSLMEDLLKRSKKVVDTTCPKVKRVQVLAQQLEAEGYRIVLFGERSHPEVQALLSYLKGEISVVSSEAEWQRVFEGVSPFPVAVLAQTTFPSAIFKEFEDWVEREALSWVRIVPTLCGETEVRQRELEKAIEENPEDVVIVVGGKHSANTRSLFLLASRKGAQVFWVENRGELESLSLPSGKSFFVVSGTSTPDSIVAEVVAYLREL
ncbi:MAG: 4-hydroxy-3-methylbut-2-enyl diphosphate reductase [Candidatus Caldatribacterium sp.]|nr:4-hydroxy-3-methylbut-2-enyl diphosphate reductase [Candidatus Caldatribacterium sp.]